MKGGQNIVTDSKQFHMSSSSQIFGKYIAFVTSNRKIMEIILCSNF